MGYCCGVDWGGSVHAVCVIDDADGHVVARFTINHTAEGLAELRRRLDKIAPAATIPIAIERPSGLIVEGLWLSNRAPSVKFFLAKQISARAAAWSWRELATAER